MAQTITKKCLYLVYRLLLIVVQADRPKIHSVSNVHAVFERDPAICTQISYMPLPNAEPITNVFSFCRQILDTWCFCMFRDIWALRDPTFPAKKQPNKHSLTAPQGNTKQLCAKFHGQSLENGVDILALCAVNAKKIRLRIVIKLLLGFSVDSIWGVKYDFVWSFSVSSSNIRANLCTNMPWNTWKRLVRKSAGGSVCIRVSGNGNT